MMYTKESVIHGIGVYSDEEIKVGELFTFGVTVMPKDFASVYTYPWSKDYSCIVNGVGSYFNHSETPNFKVVSIDKDKMTKTFMSLIDIKVDEEIVICYGVGRSF